MVATADDTTVTITPSVAARPGIPPASRSTSQLDMGEAYQLPSTEDLTGTRIIAEPAGGGVRRPPVRERAASPPSSCDHLVEQLTPGRHVGPAASSRCRWPRARAATRSGSSRREDGTTVKINGATVATLDAGELPRAADRRRLRRSRPTSPCCSCSTPTARRSTARCRTRSWSIVPPFEQFQDAYTVSTPDDGVREQLPQPRGARRRPRATCGSTASRCRRRSSRRSRARGSRARRSRSSPAATASTAPAPFGVTVYGFDEFDSYGYGGGHGAGRGGDVDAARAHARRARTLVTGTDGCVEATG